LAFFSKSDLAITEPIPPEAPVIKMFFPATSIESILPKIILACTFYSLMIFSAHMAHPERDQSWYEYLKQFLDKEGQLSTEILWQSEVLQTRQEAKNALRALREEALKYLPSAKADRMFFHDARHAFRTLRIEGAGVQLTFVRYSCTDPALKPEFPDCYDCWCDSLGVTSDEDRLSILSAPGQHHMSKDDKDLARRYDNKP
jgi:hypothetical protein